jgi:hypothetical protein
VPRLAGCESARPHCPSRQQRPRRTSQKYHLLPTLLCQVNREVSSPVVRRQWEMSRETHPANTTPGVGFWVKASQPVHPRAVEVGVARSDACRPAHLCTHTTTTCIHQAESHAHAHTHTHTTHTHTLSYTRALTLERMESRTHAHNHACAMYPGRYLSREAFEIWFSRTRAGTSGRSPQRRWYGSRAPSGPATTLVLTHNRKTLMRWR